MKGKKIAALNRRGLHNTEDPPTIDSRQLTPSTRKRYGRGHTSGKRKRQSESSDSQSQDSGRDGQDMELDDEGNDNDGSNGVREGDGDRNESIDEANDQINFDDVEGLGDGRDEGNVVSESESEKFLKTYGHFRIYLRKATRREAEKEFLRNKRELVALPKHDLSEKQQKALRFCPWALQQVEKRINLLKGKEAARGEASASDGLSESDENKRWKMYGIIGEDESRYLIAWKGVDRKTGQAHRDDWTAKENVDEKDIREWEAYKLEKAQEAV